MVGRTVRWGFDVGEAFYPFVEESTARLAADKYSDEVLRANFDKLSVSMCPVVEEDAAG